MKLYLCADWVLRSAALGGLIEELLDNVCEEECQYSFEINEDFFYQMSKNEENIFEQDKELAGGELVTQLRKGENGESVISWSFPSKRYFLEIDDLEEMEELLGNFPEITIGFGDLISLGVPEVDEKMITLHLPESNE